MRSGTHWTALMKPLRSRAVKQSTLSPPLRMALRRTRLITARQQHP